jgi:hypothetical protein
MKNGGMNEKLNENGSATAKLDRKEKNLGLHPRISSQENEKEKTKLSRRKNVSSRDDHSSILCTMESLDQLHEHAAPHLRKFWSQRDLIPPPYRSKYYLRARMFLKFFH